MEYRKLPHGSEQISVLGFGTSSIGMAGEKEMEATITMALEMGSIISIWLLPMGLPFPPSAGS